MDIIGTTTPTPPSRTMRLLHAVLLLTIHVRLTLTSQQPSYHTEEPHPDVNDEDYPGMIYVGKMYVDGSSGVLRERRVGFEKDNDVLFIFGTGFDSHHKAQEEWDMHLEHFGSFADEDIADRAHRLKHEENVRDYLKKKRHGTVPEDGMPKRYGHVDTHPLDGGVTPPKFVQLEPFFLDAKPVTNAQFSKFVRSTAYETEAEKFGWSFVLSSFVRRQELLYDADVDPEAESWVAIKGAYWRAPEGPGSSYKNREHHPVVHVSHRDAAEYCTWVGKRLPGEREYEAAARAGYWHSENRTLYTWGDDDSLDIAAKHANLWQGDFPWNNTAQDGWKGTSPVGHFPPNNFGFYDMIGNVWEWMRGGKNKARIVRGASYVDSVDGHINHASTLGARSTLHGTTGTGNIGFRCAKSPKRRSEWHWVYHDEEVHGTLTIEDEFRKEHTTPEKGWEDLYEWGLSDSDDIEEDEEESLDGYVTEISYDENGKKQARKKRKVKKHRTRFSAEL